MSRQDSSSKLNWSDADVSTLKRLVRGGFSLHEVSTLLGRTYTGVSHKAAAALSIADRSGGSIGVPRSQGLNKRQLKTLFPKLMKWKKSWNGFCRVNYLDTVLAATAFAEAYPKEWPDLEIRFDMEHVPCPGCVLFYYRKKKGGRKSCSARCSSRILRDASYFSGARMQAIGMVEGVCQLCLEHKTSGLSSHHIVGKVNDQDNLFLAALCVGCHQLVTTASIRTFLFEQGGWMRLIRFVLARKSIRIESFRQFASYQVYVGWTPLTMLQYCETEGIDPLDFTTILNAKNAKT